jgi:hypothetical protein
MIKNEVDWSKNERKPIKNEGKRSKNERENKPKKKLKNIYI